MSMFVPCQCDSLLFHQRFVYSFVHVVRYLENKANKRDIGSFGEINDRTSRTHRSTLAKTSTKRSGKPTEFEVRVHSDQTLPFILFTTYEGISRGMSTRYRALSVDVARRILILLPLRWPFFTLDEKHVGDLRERNEGR